MSSYYFLENSVNDDLIYKIETIENEMDIRVESLIAEVQKYRNEFLNKLERFKKSFLRYFKNILTIVKLND